MVLTWLWTICAAVGVIYTTVNGREAVLDLRAIRGAKVNGARSLLARSSIIAESLRFTTLVMFLAVGINALAFPTWAGGRYLFEYGLVIGAACVTVNSVYGRGVRLRLRRILEELEA